MQIDDDPHYSLESKALDCIGGLFKYLDDSVKSATEMEFYFILFVGVSMCTTLSFW